MDPPLDGLTADDDATAQIHDALAQLRGLSRWEALTRGKVEGVAPVRDALVAKVRDLTAQKIDRINRQAEYRDLQVAPEVVDEPSFACEARVHDRRPDLPRARRGCGQQRRPGRRVRSASRSSGGGSSGDDGPSGPAGEPPGGRSARLLEDRHRPQAGVIA